MTDFAELLLEGLGFQKIQRIPSTSEKSDVHRLSLFLEGIKIDRICLAARRDPVFGATLVVLLQSQSLSLFMDSSTINAASTQSKDYLMDLFDNIERLRYMDSIIIAEDYIADTREFSAFDAYQCFFTTVPFYPDTPMRLLMGLLENPGKDA
jgi:hypothetical protein